MHRSGTSFVAKLLYEMGEDFGPSELLLGADKYNEKGYFENRDIFLENDYMIHGGRSRSIQYWLKPKNRRDFRIRIFRKFSGLKYFQLMLSGNRGIKAREEELKSLCEKYYHSMVKDPRFCLTIGHWQRYCGIKHIFFCYRHPFEVAMSLKKRDQMPLFLGYRLWAFHNAEFLRKADLGKVTLVNYNNFFDEERKLEEIQTVSSAIGGNFSLSEIENFHDRVLERHLRHHEFGRF